MDPGSPAARAGVRPGEALLAINGEPVHDLIDYEYLTAQAQLELALLAPDGARRAVRVAKRDEEPLGLGFATSLMSDMRTCSNRCIFCFVDQMPRGVRKSLSVKDDDWRLSFIMGNYVTLTKRVPRRSFPRILRRPRQPAVRLRPRDGAGAARADDAQPHCRAADGAARTPRRGGASLSRAGGVLPRRERRSGAYAHAVGSV